MLDRYPKSSSQQLIRAITLTKVLAATPQDLLLLASVRRRFQLGLVAFVAVSDVRRPRRRRLGPPSA